MSKVRITVVQAKDILIAKHPLLVVKSTKPIKPWILTVWNYPRYKLASKILLKLLWDGKNAFNAPLVVQNLLFGEILPLQSIQVMAHQNTHLWSTNKNAVSDIKKRYSWWTLINLDGDTDMAIDVCECDFRLVTELQQLVPNVDSLNYNPLRCVKGKI